MVVPVEPNQAVGVVIDKPLTITRLTGGFCPIRDFPAIWEGGEIAPVRRILAPIFRVVIEHLKQFLTNDYHAGMGCTVHVPIAIPMS